MKFIIWWVNGGELLGKIISKLNDFHNKDLLKNLYHGTTLLHSQAIQKKINCNKSTRVKDFGKGFYITSNYNLAKQTAIKASNREADDPCVLEFKIDEKFYGTTYSILVFDSINSNWLGYILSNKSRNKNNIIKSFPNYYTEFYDIVYGPLADGVPNYYALVNEFNNLEGEITDEHKRDFMNAISKSFNFPGNDQFRFNNNEDINNLLNLHTIHDF